MTCEECRFYIADGNAVGEKAAIEHMERCGECRRVAYALEELGRCLRAVRDGAPELPASLDTAVMESYHREMEHVTAPSRRSVAMRFAWAAMAAGLVLGAVLLVAHRKPQPVLDPIVQKAPAEVPVATAHQNVALSTPLQAKPATAHVRVAHLRVAHLRVTHRRPVETPAALTATESPANGFQDLMYCDALSCGGAMQVIRIQVPVTAMERMPSLRTSNGFVQADVVVGSDGVARAIRVVR